MQDCVISKHATDCVYTFKTHHKLCFCQNILQISFMSKYMADCFMSNHAIDCFYNVHPNIPQVVFLLIHTIDSIKLEKQF